MSRQSLFNQDPHCHWCRVSVVLCAERRPNQATIDHVRSKYECHSRAQYNAQENKVLACYRCNQIRNAAFWQSNKHKSRPRWLREPGFNAKKVIERQNQDRPVEGFRY